MINLVTTFQPLVDEKFSTESKSSILSSQNFSWTGAHSIKLYKISTSPMNDYDRAGTNTATNWSRYGAVASLDATTEELTLTRDRSFTFCLDALDSDETAQQLSAASALERELREVAIPEIDSYLFGVACDKAGTKPAELALTPQNIYGEIIKGSLALDNAQVPDSPRYLVVSPQTYYIMKQSANILLSGTEVAADMAIRGVIGTLDGLTVVKVPASRLPAGFGFLVLSPEALVCPTKLQDFQTHLNPPGLSGTLVEGRLVYDCFALDNKLKGLYYQAQPVKA